MKVTDFYAQSSEPLISFEIIPPKRGKSINSIFEALDQVMPYRPPFIDVTAHAAEAYYEELDNGNIRRHIRRKRPGTIGLCAAIKHRYNVEPVPHILCKGFTREETEDALIELNFLGIQNVLAIRGDDHGAPKPYNADRTINEYAVDLVRQVKRMNRGLYLEQLMEADKTNFCVGVGGYPEKHFEAPNLNWDILRLKEKVEAGADYIVTQMFFDNQKFFDFEAKCREAGITVPIIPGLKLITSYRQLTTLPRSFHLNIPEPLSHEISLKPDRARDIGIEWGVQQCQELLNHGVQGLHFYVMANPSAVIDVLDHLKTGLKSRAV
ncbi:5,10-methylenetetrahydrofolate reductase (NAD(P)) [Cyclonatronum proteinivorum]|uniref:Methylenetetrahydrofolate reductase n=1 Tax=Cyclonatronum proteinivorum TaxID=1457365 RepID=A0A345UGS2_9BACT|nr:methylenetetrahydrofolate reductase [Cyclonatronum proteinivorum]AXI99673.1 5,10-methylenetetrahydrofolate reductase (NAD(P)) [Cyclonatronum proteinivorum]